MQVNDPSHVSVKPESVALMYLKEKEKYMLLREAYDKLTNAFSKAEEIPVEISVKLKRLSDRLDELEQLLKKYQKFFIDDDIDI